jgi:hypothetical protein
MEQSLIATNAGNVDGKFKQTKNQPEAGISNQYLHVRLYYQELFRNRYSMNSVAFFVLYSNDLFLQLEQTRNLHHH